MNDDQLSSVSIKLANRLAPHMVPRFWRGAQTGAYNLNGKLDRKAFVVQLEGNQPVIYTPRSVTMITAE